MDNPQASSPMPDSRYSGILTIPGEQPQSMALRYQRAIRRQLEDAFPEHQNPGLADEVFSDIMTKIAEGDFRSWTPKPGQRFHKYLAQSVKNAALDYLKRQGRRAAGREEMEDIADKHEDPYAGFREDLVGKVLRSLSNYQGNRNTKPASRAGRRRNGYYTILRLALGEDTARPRKASEIIPLLPPSLRKRFEDQHQGAFRAQLHRARKLFAALLVREVAVLNQVGTRLQSVSGNDWMKLGEGRLRRLAQLDLRECSELLEILQELHLMAFVRYLAPRPGPA
jgi:hypothetical protein